jgi:chemotaxis protein MotB
MKRKKHDDHVNHERWLVSYADFITLLFAFFVVMYALSLQDVAKIKAAAESIRQAFGAPPAPSAGAGNLPSHGASQGNGFTVNPFDAQNSAPPPVAATPGSGAPLGATPNTELRETKQALDEAMSADSELAHLKIDDKMQVFYDSRGLVVRLSAPDLFEQGQVEARRDYRSVLDRIAAVVGKTGRAVRIEGYTDVSENKTRGYASDWELSAARAAWVAQYWIARHHIDPSRLSVSGLSHFRPITGGKTELARGKNRRVEIVILDGVK